MPLPLQTFPLRSCKVDMRLRTGQRWCEHQNASNDGATSKKLSQQFWKTIKSKMYELPRPGGANAKGHACQCRSLKNSGLIQVGEDPLEVGMETHFSVFLPGESHRSEEPDGTVHGVAKRPWPQLKWLSLQDAWMFKLDSNKAKSDLKGA